MAIESECHELRAQKMSRAAGRERNLLKKQAVSGRTTAAQPQSEEASARRKKDTIAPNTADTVVGQKARRGSTKTGRQLKADMTSISGAKDGSWSMWLKKPKVPSSMDYAKAAEVFVEELMHDQVQMDAVLECGASQNTHVDCNAIPDAHVASAVSLAAEGDTAKIDWSALISLPEKGESSEPQVEDMDTTAESIQQEEDAEDDLNLSPICELHQSAQLGAEGQTSSDLAGPDVSSDVTEREKRNAVLRKLMEEQRRSHELESQRLHEGQLRAQEAEEAALAAKALAQVAEQKAREAEAAAHQLQLTQEAQKKVEEQSRCAPSTEIKLALQLEKQRAAEYRRKRNQASQLRELKEKADRTLREAQAIKEQAVADAAVASAQLLAQARTEALAAAGAEALALRSQAEAEANEIKAHAEEAARALQTELETARECARRRELELEALQAAVAAAAAASKAEGAALDRAADFDDEAQWEIVPDTTEECQTKGHGWDLVA